MNQVINQTQVATQAIPQVVPSTNSSDDVTSKVDPTTIPTSKVSSDLDALKSAEEFMTGTNDTVGTPKVRVNKPINSNQPQELQALQLKNPFKGE